PSPCNPRAGSFAPHVEGLKRRSTMFHSSTELLIDYWRRRSGGQAMPARAEIAPSGFAHLAAQAFIAVREDGGDVRLRLAGEAIRELHGRRVAGDSLLRLWRADCRGRLAGLL